MTQPTLFDTKFEEYHRKNPQVFEMFKRRRIESVSWSYGMSGKDKRKDRSELLIFSDDIEKITAS